MRDLFFVAFLGLFFLLAFRRPFIFALAYLYIDVIAPQRLSYFLLNSIPISAIAFALMVLGFLMDPEKRDIRISWRQAAIGLLLAYCAYMTTQAVEPLAAVDKWNWVSKSMIFAFFLPLLLHKKLRFEVVILTYVLCASALIVTGGIKTILSGGGGYGLLVLLIDENQGLYESSIISLVAIGIIPLILWLANHGTIFGTDWKVKLYAGALMTVVLGTGLLPWPSIALLPVLAIAAILAGAVLLLVPALLKTRFGVDEVVTTLLFNFIFLLFISMLLEGPLKDPMGMGWPKSARVISEARLPRIFEGLRVHWGFALALISAVVIWVIQTRSTLGFEMRAVGLNKDAAAFAGIPVNLVLVKTALLSGGLAARGGFSEVAGLKGSLTLDLSPGFGYTGIIVAMLALLNPIGVIVAALFVAGVFVGADSMSRAADVPTYLADIMLATALLLMVLAILLTKFRVRRD